MKETNNFKVVQGARQQYEAGLDEIFFYNEKKNYINNIKILEKIDI